MAKNKPYRIFVFAFARSWGALLYLLPRRILLAFGRWAGYIAFFIAANHRQATIHNLTTAFGEKKSKKEIEQMALGVFLNLAQTGVEVLQFPKWKNYLIEDIIDSNPPKRIYEELLAQGRGVITITSHIGNWELLGGLLAMKGLKAKAIARRLRDPHFQNWVESLRKSIGVDLIYRDESPKKIFDCLRNGEGLGLLPDQDIAGLKGVFVPFFGKPAHTSIAPVKLSLATGAPILTVFLIRIPHDRYKIIWGDKIQPQIETTKAAALQKYTERWMKDVEDMIRQYPEQWGWMHDRWKTQLKTAEK